MKWILGSACRPLHSLIKRKGHESVALKESMIVTDLVHVDSPCLFRRFRFLRRGLRDCSRRRGVGRLFRTSVWFSRFGLHCRSASSSGSSSSSDSSASMHPCIAFISCMISFCAFVSPRLARLSISRISSAAVCSTDSLLPSFVPFARLGSHLNLLS